MQTLFGDDGPTRDERRAKYRNGLARSRVSAWYWRHPWGRSVKLTTRDAAEFATDGNAVQLADQMGLYPRLADGQPWASVAGSKEATA